MGALTVGSPEGSAQVTSTYCFGRPAYCVHRQQVWSYACMLSFFTSIFRMHLQKEEASNSLHMDAQSINTFSAVYSLKNTLHFQIKPLH